MGDINFNALTDNVRSKVTEIEPSFLLKQIIASPTRLATVSQTLIDHNISSFLSPTESEIFPFSFKINFSFCSFYLKKNYSSYVHLSTLTIMLFFIN